MNYKSGPLNIKQKSRPNPNNRFGLKIIFACFLYDFAVVVSEVGMLHKGRFVPA